MEEHCLPVANYCFNQNNNWTEFVINWLISGEALLLNIAYYKFGEEKERIFFQNKKTHPFSERKPISQNKHSISYEQINVHTPAIARAHPAPASRCTTSYCRYSSLNFIKIVTFSPKYLQGIGTFFAECGKLTDLCCILNRCPCVKELWFGLIFVKIIICF